MTTNIKFRAGRLQWSPKKRRGKVLGTVAVVAFFLGVFAGAILLATWLLEDLHKKYPQIPALGFWGFMQFGLVYTILDFTYGRTRGGDK